MRNLALVLAKDKFTASEDAVAGSIFLKSSKVEVKSTLTSETLLNFSCNCLMCSSALFT